MAYTGTSGLEMAHSYQPLMALLDIGLPQMDGFEIRGAFVQIQMQMEYC